MHPTGVWIGNGDGWQDLSGITRIAIDEPHQPIHVGIGYDPPDWIEGYGTGEIRGLVAPLEGRWFVTPVELALMILRPHLANCPLYRGA